MYWFCAGGYCNSKARRAFKTYQFCNRKEKELLDPPDGVGPTSIFDKPIGTKGPKWLL